MEYLVLILLVVIAVYALSYERLNRAYGASLKRNAVLSEKWIRLYEELEVRRRQNAEGMSEGKSENGSDLSAYAEWASEE